MEILSGDEEESDWGSTTKTSDSEEYERLITSSLCSSISSKGSGSNETNGSKKSPSKKKRKKKTSEQSLDFSIHLSSRESLASSDSDSRVPWATLPYGIMVEILSYLEEKDRVKLARTCKNFYAAFHSPALWRRKHVLFAGIRSIETASKSSVFIHNFGKHIRYLEIECGHPTLHSARPMSHAVEMFLSRLSRIRGTKITSFKIDYMDFYHGWRFFELSRARLVGSLCKFLRKQRHLQSIDVCGAQIDVRDGSRVMKALGACHARNTLQTLQMKDFFELRYLAPNNQSFLETLNKFSALRHLYVNFIYVNSMVLDILGRKLGHTLESLRMVVDSSEPQTRSINSYDWLTLRERSPNCKAIFHFLGMLSHQEYTSAMCRGAPVIEVDILSWEGYPNDLEPNAERMADVVRHISNNFHNDIVRFRISIDHASDDPLDCALIGLLQRCPKLREFTVNSHLTLQTVDTICKLAAKRMPKVLDHLELRVRGLSPEENSQLASITQIYLSQINKRQLELRPDPN